MSLHATPSEQALQAIQTQKRNSILSSIIVSLLACALIGLILSIIALVTESTQLEEIVSYSAPSDQQEQVQKPELTNEVSRKPSAPAASMASVITSTVASPVAVPVPDIVVTEPTLDYGDSTDFGEGWGDGAGNFGSGGSKFTPFGRSGGEGMNGAFYDLKQDGRKRITNLGKVYQDPNGNRVNVFKEEIRRLNRGRYSNSRLRKYFKADVALNFTHLIMQQTAADAAPVAFGVEKEVEPSGWIVVYEGKFSNSANGEYRFAGRYDDLLLVYINNKLVFDGSWSDHSGDFDKGEELPGPSLVNVPHRAGEYFTIKKGAEIRIVIGESPGGLVGGGLLIEKKGHNYKKTSSGTNILPPFTTEPLRNEDIEKLKQLSMPLELMDVPMFPIR